MERYVVFESATPKSQPMCTALYLWDRLRRTTRELPLAADNPPRAPCAMRPAINSDGQWVAFESAAQDLVDGVDANGSQQDIYVWNTQTDRFARISVDSHGAQSPTGSSYGASLSAAGRFVAFTSTGCLNGGSISASANSASERCKPQVHVRDLVAGLTRSIKAPGDVWPNGPTYSPALSGDGRYVVFVSAATNLAQGDTNEKPDIYLFDLASGSTALVSRTPGGKAGNGASSRPAISESGQFVAFDSTASDLICIRRCAARDRDHNLVSDIFMLDRVAGRMRRLSQAVTGEPWWTASIAPALDGGAGLIAFSSRHPMEAGDVRGDFDLFVFHVRK